MTPMNPTQTTSTVRRLLNLEGLSLFIASIVVYAYFQGNGWLFGALLLVPDLSMIGYLRNPRVGSWTYNAVHALIVPVLLFAVALAAGQMLIAQIALIWLAHIGMDRTVGYGLKYADAFKSTHLQKV